MVSERKRVGLIELLVFGIFLSTIVSCKEKKETTRKSTVLHFTETTGWDHKTRDVSRQMFIELGDKMNFELIHSNESEVFDKVDVLDRVDVIIFCNTTGDSLLTKSQQLNFEKFINDGGDYIGIHSASDTHRTNWEFYSSLVGAILQIELWHTASDYMATMKQMTKHELLNDIPDPWKKEEEYYYWDLNGGRIDTQNITTLLEVERTGPKSYDRKRPTAWFQELPSGTKSFYTSLGHSAWNYEYTDNDFRKLIENALVWTLDSAEHKNN